MGANPGGGDAEERRMWQGGHDHISGALLYHAPLHLQRCGIHNDNHKTDIEGWLAPETAEQVSTLRFA